MELERAEEEPLAAMTEEEEPYNPCIDLCLESSNPFFSELAADEHDEPCHIVHIHVARAPTRNPPNAAAAVLLPVLPALEYVSLLEEDSDISRMKAKTGLACKQMMADEDDEEDRCCRRYDGTLRTGMVQLTTVHV